MKKIIIVLNFLVLALFISGCGCSKKEKILKCSYEEERPTYFKYNADIELYYNSDDEVLKSVDKNLYKLYENGDKNILEEQSQLIDWLYEKYETIDYYDMEQKIENDTLLATITIDYKKINMNMLIEINEFYDIYNQNKKIMLQDMVDYYQRQGYKCYE